MKQRKWIQSLSQELGIAREEMSKTLEALEKRILEAIMRIKEVQETKKELTTTIEGVRGTIESVTKEIEGAIIVLKEKTEAESKRLASELEATKVISDRAKATAEQIEIKLERKLASQAINNENHHKAVMGRLQTIDGIVKSL